jgi:hypothetical protein
VNKRDGHFPYRRDKTRTSEEKQITALLRFLHHSAVKQGLGLYPGLEEERALSKDLLTLRRQALFPQSPARQNANSLWRFMHADAFSKLRKYFTLLEERFDDMHDRVQTLGIIKDLLHQLKNELHPDLHKYERRICLIIHDAIHKTKAERLTAEHIDVLSRSIDALVNGNCNKQTFRRVDQWLRHHGLNWIMGDDGE